MSPRSFLLLAALLASALAAPFPVSVRAGLTLDPCESDDECVGDRTCLNVCAPPTPRFCASTQDCVAGEICVESPNGEGIVCISEAVAADVGLTEESNGDSSTPLFPDVAIESPEELLPTPDGDIDAVVPSPSPDTLDPVCIDADALTHLSNDELVFATHATARVLCDANGSCATKGHMVTWNSKAVMMRTYCDVVGCEEKVMKVNSPRYKRGLRVKSKTEGLEYTAFAARYESTAEEAVLKAAVRMGL